MFHSISLGLAIAACCDSPTMAGIINPFFITILILFSGIFQPPGSMPSFWSSWMYWLDPYHYFLEGLITNALDSVKVICGENNFIKIKAPPGQNCGEYMADFFSNGGLGYIGNPNSTDYCDYCQYTIGNDYYESRIGWSFSNRWRDFGILWIFTIFNVVAFLLFTYLFRKQRR